MKVTRLVVDTKTGKQSEEAYDDSNVLSSSQALARDKANEQEERTRKDAKDKAVARLSLAAKAHPDSDVRLLAELVLAQISQ